MDSLRLDTLADHLVAWHNSHPLARRITVAHVTSLGYVVLPFARAHPAAAAWAPDPAPDPAADPSPEPTPAPAPATAPAPALVEPAAAAESDERIDVLIDVPDFNLRAVSGIAPEVPAAVASAEGSAAAPVDIAVDKAIAGAATLAADVPQSLPEATPAAEPTVSPGPSPTVAGLGAGATLRERAVARAQRMAQEASAIPTAELKPIFSQDFIPPLRPAAVAEFAARHGVASVSPGKDVLVRVVRPDPGMVYPVIEQCWLLTAQIDIGGHCTRVLAGAGPNPVVMGQRLSRLPRLAGLIGPPLAVAAAAGVWWLWPGAPKPASAAAAPPPAASAASASSAGPAANVAMASAPAPAESASGTQTPASAPIDVEPTLGRVDLPSLGPIVDERRRVAAATAEAKAAAAATVAIGKAEKSVPPTAVAGPAFAVSTRLLRTRTESEQLAEAMRALLAGSGPPGLQVQALRSGDDWRVVVWPYNEHAQAEQARALLASRGMKVAVIDF